MRRERVHPHFDQRLVAVDETRLDRVLLAPGLLARRAVESLRALVAAVLDEARALVGLPLLLFKESLGQAEAVFVLFEALPHGLPQRIG